MARRGRLLIGASGLVAASVAGGFIAARQISSPADAASKAKPPVAGPVTAPLEERALHSQIVTRGDAVFDDAIDVRVDTTHVAGAAVLTSNPPAVGTAIDEGAVMFEIAGRPVIALGGDLSTYRDLAPGSTGPDVHELEVSLQRLGFDPGMVDDTFDAATSSAVGELYQRLGYSSPVAAVAVAQRVGDASTAAKTAHDALVAAFVALTNATKGPKASEKLSLDDAVKAAQRALTTAQQGGDPNAIADANEHLQVTKAERTEGLAPPDVSAEQAALMEAQSKLDDADKELADAQAASRTPLPAAEIVFIPDLPRRVDKDAIERGALVNGPVISISGSNVVILTELTSTDKPLISLGMAVQVAGPTGATIDGTIATVTDSTAPANVGGAHVVVSLTHPTTEQIEAIRGLNVKVTVPIASTNGEVLCAPLASLTAGDGGESRVEVAAADGTTQLVTVTVGLVADGFAEITDDQHVLKSGQRVVVGR